MMWGFWDKAHWRPDAAIINGDNWQINKAGEAYLRYAVGLPQICSIGLPQVCSIGLPQVCSIGLLKYAV